MRNLHRRLVLALAFAALVALPADAANELTVADVEAASGLKGVAIVAKNSIPGGRGDINFVRADGKLLLLVNFGAASDYATAKEQFGKATDIAGIGDEAFMPAAYPWALYARKGGNYLGLGSGLDPATGSPILTPAQLQQLAKLVAGRM